MHRNIKAIAAAGFAALILGLAPASARAEQIFGVTFGGFDNSQLIRIDSATQEASLVADLGQSLSAYGLARYNNELYVFDSNENVLRIIDADTGTVSSPVDIGLTDTLLGEGDLAIRQDGVGVISSALNPSTFETDPMLYRFDLTDGTSTALSTDVVFDGLAFGRDGTLFGLEQFGTALYTIDAMTGVSTLVGSTGFTGGSFFAGLTFGLDGSLLAALDDRLFRIDTSSGLATAIDPDPLNLIGNGAFASISGIAAVPEPSSMALLGGGMALIQFLAARRRRTS